MTVFLFDIKNAGLKALIKLIKPGKITFFTNLYLPSSDKMFLKFSLSIAATLAFARIVLLSS